LTVFDCLAVCQPAFKLSVAMLFVRTVNCPNYSANGMHNAHID
jgi:hypothetical protein